MAVCNLFSELQDSSGNFLMFSQYVEDLTKNGAEGDNYKVIPSKFVAFNIDYSKINFDRIDPKNTYGNLNKSLPKYLQNCFENACAVGRGKTEDDWKNNLFNYNKWTPEISRNLFWNCMFDGDILHASDYGSTKKLDELVYYGDVSMHSYNEHLGMGYSEIYCYIPTDAAKMNCQVVCSEERIFESLSNSTLEGRNESTAPYTLQYYYNKDFTMSFDDEEVGALSNSNDASYKINTIVVLYDVLKKLNDEWVVEYANMPMGIYFTGVFNEYKLSNATTKYVNTSFGTGTSYGLRICTRFSVAPNAKLHEDTIAVNDNDNINLCQLMSYMSENLALMLDIVKTNINTEQNYKDVLSVFKNNKTNVPYIKDVNGVDYWFVNGKPVSIANANANNECNHTISKETIEKRLKNLQDNDTTNDYVYIPETNGCDSGKHAITANELAEYISNSLGWQTDTDKYPDHFINDIPCNCENNDNTNTNSNKFVLSTEHEIHYALGIDCDDCEDQEENLPAGDNIAMPEDVADTLNRTEQ